MNNFGFGGSNAHFILEQAPKLDSFSPTDAVIAERVLLPTINLRNDHS